MASSVSTPGLPLRRRVPERQELSRRVNNITAAVFGTSSIVNTASVGPTPDEAAGFSAWTSYAFLQRWSVFARYDDLKLSEDVAPNLKDEYFNAGVSLQAHQGGGPCTGLQE